LACNWILSTAIREAPRKITYWPAYLQYIWDNKDLQASSIVLLSSPETWQSRILLEYKSKDENNKITITYSSRVTGKFEVVLLDKGYRFRYQDTRIFAGVYQLQADIYWFLTGIPIQNSATVRTLKTSIKLEYTATNLLLLGYSWSNTNSLATSRQYYLN
jgi:hypothetical protein